MLESLAPGSEVLLLPASVLNFSSVSSVLLGPLSVDVFAEAEAAVELSTVRFFRGTSTHSVISITASARSNENIPLLLSEKCKLALTGAERFRDAYLKKGNAQKLRIIDHQTPFDPDVDDSYFSLASARPDTAY